MRTLFIYLKQCLVTIILLLTISTVSIAQTANNNTNVHPSLNSTNQLLWILLDYINRTVNASVKTQENLLYQPTPELENTMSLGTGQVLSQPATQSIAHQDLLDSLKLLTTTHNNFKIIKKVSKQVPINTTLLNKLGKGFDLNSLIGTTNLDDKQIKMARNYIAFAGGLVKPYEVIKPKDFKDDLRSVHRYKVQLGINLARTAAAISTLYYFLAERTPQDNLGVLAQIPVNQQGLIDFNSDKALSKVSPLMIEKYQAEKRAANPMWYQNMEHAEPATLQRETLHIMASIQKSLFDMRMLMERQTALLALMTLQQNEEQQEELLESTRKDIFTEKANG